MRMKSFLRMLIIIASFIWFLFIDQVIEMFYPTLIIGCVSVGFYFLLRLADRLSDKACKTFIGRSTNINPELIVATAFLFFLIFLTFHIIMSIQLNPIKKDFASVTANVKPKEILDESVVSGVMLDYGGRLEAVLKKRDAMLKKHGYISIGTWWVTSEYSDISPSGDSNTSRIAYLKKPSKIFRRGVR